MITASSTLNSPLVLSMTSEPPAVYLDQWALGTIADDPSLADQFAQALGDTGGTLCLSWMSLAEMSRSSPRSIAEAQHLIEKIYPRLFFLNPNPWIVVAQEDVLAAEAASIAPHGDPDVLQALTYLDTGGLRPFTVNGLVSQFAEAAGSTDLASLADLFVSRAEDLRITAARDRAFWKRLTTVPPGPGSRAGTRFFVPQLLRPLVTNRRMKLKPNDAADFYHTAVSVCYCDYVLIDKHWATLAGQAIIRLRRAGHRAQYANVIPAGPAAIGRLLNAMKDWRTPTGTT